MPANDVIRFAAYTTHNFGGADTYDSGPGIGNGGPFEQIGDFAGDTDTGLPTTDTDNDGGGSIGTQPGANFVDLAGYSGPSSLDEVDTISAYWQISIPEPGAAALMAMAALSLGIRRRRA